jgi:hypothetical protein
MAMTGLESLETLLARRNQRFVCVDAGGPDAVSGIFTASIVHHTEPPLGQVQLDQLGRLFGDIPQLTELYGRFGSVRLYVDSTGGDSAYYIATPDEWHGLKKHFEDWLEIVDDDEDRLPTWLDEYLVIGEVPASGNYYIVPTKGEELGKVFHFDHDGFEFTEVGVDISAFLEHISTVDEALIREIRSHTRYSDGDTEIQWLAREYLYDD